MFSPPVLGDTTADPRTSNTVLMKKNVALGSLHLNRIYGTDQTLETFNVRVQGFLHSLQHISWRPESNRM